jgi:hypothetical protein
MELKSCALPTICADALPAFQLNAAITTVAVVKSPRFMVRVPFIAQLIVLQDEAVSVASNFSAA